MENYLRMASQAISMSILRNMFFRFLHVKTFSVPSIHLYTFNFLNNVVSWYPLFTALNHSEISNSLIKMNKKLFIFYRIILACRSGTKLLELIVHYHESALYLYII